MPALVGLDVLLLSAIIGMGFGSLVLRLISVTVLFFTFRHYFIKERWNTVRRGGGAPGFMMHWALLLVFAIEATRAIDRTGNLPALVLTAARIDFAVIMICAGVYKAAVGFLHAEGMEYGRANPLWGYLWAFYKRRNPRSLYIRVMNIVSSSVEIVAGVFMLLPWAWAQFAGAVGISVSFLYVAMEIRLGRLAFLLVALPLIFLPGMSASVAGAPIGSPLWESPEAVRQVLTVLIWGYIAVLPVVKVVQYVNFFGRVSLPQPFQRLISWYANWLPIIIWRVFTPDVINFFVRIHGEDAATRHWNAISHEDTTYNYKNWGAPWLKLRFLHVMESISIVSVFTTLKYFPSNRRLFQQKLISYAHSLNVSLSSPCTKFRFDYVRIDKTETCFAYNHVMTFCVDLATGEVTEERLLDSFDPKRPAARSPVVETVAPGSYL